MTVAWWSLGISLLILAVALGAAVSQGVFWRRSGPVIRVELLSALVMDLGGSGVGLGVRVWNGGRGPRTVRQWGFTLAPENKWAVAGTRKFGPSMSHRLEGHSEAVWWLDQIEARDLTFQQFPTTAHFYDVRPYVTLDGQHKKYGRRTLRLWEAGYVGREPTWFERMLHRPGVLELRPNPLRWSTVLAQEAASPKDAADRPP
jgi:hypothetical protein